MTAFKPIPSFSFSASEARGSRTRTRKRGPSTRYENEYEGTREGGFILLAVLVVTLLASMVAAGLLYRMRAETAASAAISRGEQGYAAALSGLHTALAAITTPPQGVGDASDTVDPSATPAPGGASPPPATYIADLDVWFDNPRLFRNQLVVDEGGHRWYFTIYAQNPADDKNVRYGLIDEAGKINLNTAGEDTVRALPGLTTEQIDALLDYKDQDATPRESGAEQDYYDKLPQPYLIKNGPLGSVEELLLIKGFTGGVVYGEDANFNGLLEANEDDGDEVFPPDDNDGVLNPGLLSYITTFSNGPDLDPDGKPKVNMNRASPQQLQEAGLSQDTINFIQTYRDGGQSFTHPSQLLEMQYTVPEPRRRRRGDRTPPRPSGGPAPGTVLDSPLTPEELPIVMAKLTTRNGTQPQRGLVNVNTAPPEVLDALFATKSGPGDLGGQIADARSNLDPEARASTAWLYTQGLLDADEYKRVAPLMTTRGYQYRIRCVGFGVPSGRYRVLEAVVDTVGPSRIAYIRDITRLGLPIPLNADVAEY